MTEALLRSTLNILPFLCCGAIYHRLVRIISNMSSFPIWLSLLFPFCWSIVRLPICGCT